MIVFFFFNDTATTEIYTLSLHDALPISRSRPMPAAANPGFCKTASPAATKQNAYACALHAQAERADQAVQAVQADVTGPSGLRHALHEKVQEGRDARGQRRVAVVDGADA